MAESITISGNPPELKSMQFDFLRTEGITRIQEIGGRAWTNFNLGDPGVTILEALCYAITDLGYRTSYSIPDILAPDPSLPPQDNKNFYTARQILTVAPVTFTDYRKLLIDVEVHDPGDLDCPFAGVKNAWIEKSPDNEIPVYVDEINDKLVYTPIDPNDPRKLDLKVLYDILLEFSTCEVLGDLNENTVEGKITLYNACTDQVPPPPFDQKFSGIEVNVGAEFPRWDEPGIDWNDFNSVKKSLRNVVIDFARMPSNYVLEGYVLNSSRDVELTIAHGPNNTINTTCIEFQINRLLNDPNNPDNLVALYQRKVKKVQQILCEVRRTLMANRNLCEDFFRIKALKVEEIALCADLVVETDADIEKIEAQVYFEIGNFLAPTVLFHTLDEMYAKGRKTEEIFEGPPLNHGFIDDDELVKADRRKSIHVSDLINIIMDIPGVIAVKSIQIGNVPLDNVDNIPSLSVKWCLQLAFDKNYVPRLSVDRSNITFLKNQLPFKADEPKVRFLLDELISQQRPQKLHDIALDLPVPEGTYRNIGDYQSVQEEFPLVYGIGSEGLPANATAMRRGQAHQLKGFLMFFDQLLADFLAQLSHVRDLFSMNGEKDMNGDFIIDKTYFTESLLPYVPAALDLIKNPSTYPGDLQQIAEGETLFFERRNRFLNHMMARFGEQFTDYALMVYSLSGPKAPKELLIDKLRFLDNYPEISSGRFRAFNYENRCNLWQLDNTSGLEKRISLLTGIDERTAEDLAFTANLIIDGSEPSLSFRIQNNAAIDIAFSIGTYATMAEIKFALEELIVDGVLLDNYKVLDANGTVVDDPNGSYFPPFHIGPTCGTRALATSQKTYSNIAAAEAGLVSEAGKIISVLNQEYYGNPLSNRNNLECPIESYFEIDPVVIDGLSDPPSYIINYRLYRNPIDFNPPNVVLLEGPFTGYGDCKISGEIINVIPADFRVVLSGDLTSRFAAGDPVSIKNSADNDGDYTVLKTVLISLGGGVFQTEVVFDFSPTLTTNAPFGQLYFNTMTIPEFTAWAEGRVHKSMFEVALRGLQAENYIFTDISAPPFEYRFQVTDKCGDPVGTSFEQDFNADLAAAIANHQGTLPADEIEIIESPNNNGNYTVVSAAAVADQVRIVLSTSTPVSDVIVAGKVRFGESGFSVVAVDTDPDSFIVSGNLTRKLFPGMSFNITGSDIHDGVYIVKDTLFVSPDTVITVEQRLEPGSLIFGQLSYVQELPITQVIQNMAGDELFVKGGADDVAVKQMAEFFKAKFFSHEGLHILEHILLRPKHNENHFVTFNDGAPPLNPLLPNLGDLIYMKKVGIDTVNKTNRMFFVPGDITAELAPFIDVIVKGSEDGINDGTYKVLTIGFTGTHTGIKVMQDIPSDTLTAFGELHYRHKEPIDTATFNSVSILVPLADVSGDFPVTIIGSENGVNDGNFTIDSLSGNTDILLLEREILVQDKLLEINVQTDCGACKVEDPYSFIYSVILPAWQGRFANQDFRAFFDRSLRLESPAHLVPSICWVSCEQMAVFEERYKRWLVENARKEKNPMALSNALNALIEILEQLTSQYPEGTLHDCNINDTIGNDIILNRTVLGTL